MTRFYHLFPFERVPKGSRLIIYGAGEVGQWYLAQIEQTGFAKVVAIADKAWDKYPPMGLPLIPPQAIGEYEYDYVLVSIEKPMIAREIADILVQDLHVVTNKIILGSESLCVVPRFLKAGHDVPVLAYQPHGIPVAVWLAGGMGDVIIFKRKIEEVLKWDERIVIDIYTWTKLLGTFHAFFDSEYPGRINNFIGDSSMPLYNSKKENYAFSLDFSHSVDLNIDSINESKLSFAPHLLSRCLLLREQCKSYGFIGGSQMMLHYARCRKDGYNAYTSLNRYDGFNVTDFHTHIPMRQEFLNQYEALGLHDGVYITVNYGYERHGDEPNCKSWSFKNFEIWVAMFRKKFPHIKVVQVGGDFPEIKGCDLHVMKKSIELVKYVLRGAVFHLDIEGGLVHLATQLGTRCVVLFGPTPLHYYAYPENLNIQAGNCHDCYWYTSHNWRCYRKMAEPECMTSIKPELVLKRVEEVFGEELQG